MIYLQYGQSEGIAQSEWVISNVQHALPPTGFELSVLRMPNVDYPNDLKIIIFGLLAQKVASVLLVSYVCVCVWGGVASIKLGHQHTA